MVFSSTVFLFLFLPILLLVYYLPFRRSIACRNVVLFLASLFFYAWGEPLCVFLMLFSIMVTWGIGKTLGSPGRKAMLTVGVIYHVAILFVFKYLAFFVNQFGLLFHDPSISLTIELPIGISFFTLQMMSYLFDIYYGKVEPQKNPFYVGLYVAFFPQLIAGPIVRYEQIAEQIVSRKESLADFAEGMKCFIYGLGKKVLVANYVAQIADNIFDYANGRSVLYAWLGIIAYTLQIYYDFSGYSDMAIGLGRMFGFHIPKNFDYPYVSGNVTEFWRRWHISLGRWFRDYVYIPLGGNRVSKARWIRNLFIVWALTGIWHGANWTFFCWGIFFFVLILMEKLTGLSEKKNVLTWFYMILMIHISFVIFRSATIADSMVYLGEMFGIGSSGFSDPAVFDYLGRTWSVLIIAAVGATPLYRMLIKKASEKRIWWIEHLWLLVVFIMSLLKVISNTYNPFIYFNF